jgi:uncharacterized alpha-E superfamily protein
LEVAPVVDLLLADADNPRAVAFQVSAIQDHLGHLPRESTHPNREPDRQATIKLHTMLQLADVQQVCQAVDGKRPALATLLDETTEALATISQRVGQIYFSHAQVPRHLMAPAQKDGL